MDIFEIKSSGPFVGPPQFERGVVQKEINVLHAVFVSTELTRSLKPKTSTPFGGCQIILHLPHAAGFAATHWILGNSVVLAGHQAQNDFGNVLGSFTPGIRLAIERHINGALTRLARKLYAWSIGHAARCGVALV